jgi:5-methylcytosine-specific restriction endonuclease McrA
VPITQCKTLVLNQGFEPIRVVSWQRAVTLIYRDKATILTQYNDKPLRSAQHSINAPAVIWLKRNSKRFVQKVKLTRHFIYARDNWCCQYCGKHFPASQLTFDHVVPRSQGGTTTWENIVTCCSPCNQKKGNRKLIAADMHLLRKPTRPRWMPAILVKSLRDNSIPGEWIDYIGWLIS